MQTYTFFSCICTKGNSASRAQSFHKIPLMSGAGPGHGDGHLWLLGCAFVFSYLLPTLRDPPSLVICVSPVGGVDPFPLLATSPLGLREWVGTRSYQSMDSRVGSLLCVLILGQENGDELFLNWSQNKKTLGIELLLTQLLSNMGERETCLL